MGHLTSLKSIFFFSWEEIWRKILTFNILARSGWSMVNRCIQCKSIDESTNHILIHCNKTRLLWGFFISFLSAIFKIHWVFSQLIKELLIEWKVQDMNKGKKKVWHWTPFCLFLRIWKEHNGKTFKEESYPKKTFKEEELSDQELKEIFIKCLMKWSRVSMGLANYSQLNVFDRLSWGWVFLSAGCFLLLAVFFNFVVPHEYPLYTYRVHPLLLHFFNLIYFPLKKYL